MKKTQVKRYLFASALAAALMIGGMFAASLVWPQLNAFNFTLVADPAEYQAALLASDLPLRVFLTLDNLFLTFYTAVFIFLAIRLWSKERGQILIAVALGALLVTAYLDLQENHELITFLHMSQLGWAIEPQMLHSRMVWSQLKFHSSYLGLFLFAFLLPDKTLTEKVLRWTLLVAFVPIGILVYTFPQPIFELLRFTGMLAGLALLAWNTWQELKRD